MFWIILFRQFGPRNNSSEDTLFGLTLAVGINVSVYIYICVLHFDLLYFLPHSRTSRLLPFLDAMALCEFVRFFFLPSVESWELHQRSLNLVCRWVNLLTVCSFFPIFIVCLIFIYFFPSFVLVLPLASLLRCISLSPLPGYVCFFSFFFLLSMCCSFVLNLIAWAQAIPNTLAHTRNL